MQKITEHHYDSINKYNRKTTVLSIWNSAYPERKWHFLLTPDEMQQNEEQGFSIENFYKQEADFPHEYFTFNLQSQTLCRASYKGWSLSGEQWKRLDKAMIAEYPCWEFNDNVEIFFKPK